MFVRWSEEDRPIHYSDLVPSRFVASAPLTFGAVCAEPRPGTHHIDPTPLRFMVRISAQES
jgi:hypothetical protein